MSRIMLLQAVTEAWRSYLKKMNRKMKPYSFDKYLEQELEMGMKLSEFAEIVYIEGFTAGEKHAKAFMVGNKRCQPHLN